MLSQGPSRLLGTVFPAEKREWLSEREADQGLTRSVEE
ncbi:hypothetical protein KR50_25870 [Jeotgalibacillus campisalis]|uniref:Uncharacterized protein n=1 Tax=Jeotgalibacillus campisalis TaxID=220754 RepID=A0A0C2VPH7_9BACL|nr:hypothetical protein KR50_25870 [Jeotgalibacillus campisalis]